MIDKSRCVVVVPVYKKFEDYNDNEQRAFWQTLHSFPGREVVIVCPDSLSSDYRSFSRIALDKKYFSYSGYNLMCKSDWFYQLFLDLNFTYMCLVQLDVWIFQDNLEYFLNEFDKDQLDYIGAPWAGVWFAPDGTVGNGGFCIRRLEKFRDICQNNSRGGGNEDTFFLQFFNKEGGIKTAPSRLAAEFSWEEKPYFWYRLMNSRLPMGCHAYASTPDRIGFWKNFISGIREIKCKAGRVDIYNNPEFEKKFRNE